MCAMEMPQEIDLERRCAARTTRARPRRRAARTGRSRRTRYASPRPVPAEMRARVALRVHPECPRSRRRRRSAGKLDEADRVREEVVHERDAREPSRRARRGRVDDPGQVRGLAAAVAHGAGDAESGGVDAAAREEVLDGPLESRDSRLRNFFSSFSHEPARLDLEEGEANVACRRRRPRGSSGGRRRRLRPRQILRNGNRGGVRENRQRPVGVDARRGQGLVVEEDAGERWPPSPSP